MGELRISDLDAVREQLGREPVIGFSITARCAQGHPLVIRNDPFDAQGDPFPTTFWLTCPEAVKAVSRIEAGGAIKQLNERLGADAELASELTAAHEEYARERARFSKKAANISGGVGGTRTGVKCLHAHYANHLAGGNDPAGSWVANLVEPFHSGESPAGRVVAAIDQGTNSSRLLVLDADGNELARDMVITRLGKGVDETGELNSESLTATLDVIRRYCRRAAAHHADKIRLAATSAVRDASNRADFEDAVLAASGEAPEVLSGEREAQLSFLGATRGLEVTGPVCVLDIGGGSTEFIVGTSSISTQMGSVRLTERFVRTDPPDGAEIEAMQREITEVLAGVDETVPVESARTLIAVAGTATTFQAIALGLDRYDPDRIHRTALSLDDVREVLGILGRMSVRERAALPVMAPGRADVIIAGGLILEAVMTRWNFADCLVSEHDILDGLAAEMLDNR